MDKIFLPQQLLENNHSQVSSPHNQTPAMQGQSSAINKPRISISPNKAASQMQLLGLELNQKQSSRATPVSSNTQNLVLQSKSLLNVINAIDQQSTSTVSKPTQLYQNSLYTQKVQNKSRIKTQRQQSQADKLFTIGITPSYTKKDFFVNKMLDNQKLHNKLTQMKSQVNLNSIELLQTPTKQLNKQEIDQAQRFEVYKQLAKQEQMTNLVQIANNYNRKIPITSLNLKFNTKQQYFSFEDPQTKSTANIHNRDKVQEMATTTFKQQSLASKYISQITKKVPQLPQLMNNGETTLKFINESPSQIKKSQSQQIKLSQRLQQMPRNLVTNNIMSLQRQEFLQKTLYARKNLKTELRDNNERFMRKLDNIFFDSQMNMKSPLFKMQNSLRNIIEPKNKLLSLVNGIKIHVDKTYSEQMAIFMDSLSPQESTKEFFKGDIIKNINIVELLEQNQGGDLNELAAQYFKDNEKTLDGEDNPNTNKSPIQEGENEEVNNSFIKKISNFNNKTENQIDFMRPITMSQWKQNLQDKQEEIGQGGNANKSFDEFVKEIKKPMNQMPPGIIVKERALPQHKMIRKKAMSILKY